LWGCIGSAGGAPFHHICPAFPSSGHRLGLIAQPCVCRFAHPACPSARMVCSTKPRRVKIKKARWWDRLGGRPVSHTASPRFVCCQEQHNFAILKSKKGNPCPCLRQTKNERNPQLEGTYTLPLLILILDYTRCSSAMQAKNWLFSVFLPCHWCPNNNEHTAHAVKYRQFRLKS
jgi:hypothetical protein